MLTRSYAELSAKISARGAEQRTPLKASIEVTHRCPLTCSHCYNNLPMADGEARRAELSFDEHCRLVDDIVAAGCLWLLYTGGEIFARRDFLDIYRYARSKGLFVTLFTNGILITKAIADALAELPPFAIEITLYGRTRETYEKLTRVPGSYDRCMRGIDLLLERKLPLRLKTVGVSTNKHEIGAMKAFAEERGVGFKFDSMINPRTDCSSSPLGVRLLPEEVVALDFEDQRRVDGWRKYANQFSEPVHTGANSETVYHCGGGVHSFAVDPYGKLSICVLSQQDQYDLRAGSFREGWGEFLHKVRMKKRTLLTKCVACGLKAMCGMCPAQGELENRDAEKPVEFLCEVAHLRAHALSIPVRAHGECEHCPGGSRHVQTVKKAEALRDASGSSHVAVLGPDKGSSRSLTVLQEAGGGCESCSTGAT